MRSWIGLAATCWLVGWCGSTRVTAKEPTHRWLYLQRNLQVSEAVEPTKELLRRAAAAGYTAVVLADYKLNILDRVPDHYFRNAAAIKKAAAELKLEIIPAVASIGYSSGILAHDPNLAEGIPCRGVPLIVQGNVVDVASELVDALPGGSFEDVRSDRFAGWDFQDHIGKASFADRQIKHGGATAIRFENIGTADPEHGHGRVSKAIRVRPWRQYHAAAWIKTDEFTSGEIRMFAMGQNGRVLSYSDLRVRRTQDWRQHHILFNSLENEQIRLYLGVWGGKAGKLWFDDVTFVQTAFVQLVRRAGCPLTIKDASGRALVEGRDFAKLSDPKMGTVPYAGNYDVYHEPPQLKLLPAAKLQSGQRLTADFYHAVVVHSDQVACCLGDEKVFAVVEDQVRRVKDLFSPKTYFLSHDEIRVANWCLACNREGRSAGQLLAENVRRISGIVRKVDSAAKLCVWSDMFDPHHNANDNYYLVNGNLTGSWEGLAQDVVVVNWHQRNRPSLEWFAKRGHAQVLAGFYDGPAGAIRDWLDRAAGLPNVEGVMYTTWRGDFTQLEPFARALRTP
jgi:hypothetical protein